MSTSSPHSTLRSSETQNDTIALPPTSHSSSKMLTMLMQKMLKQQGFQRLYLEYYTYLQDLDVELVSKLYQQGLQYNLKRAHFNLEVLRYVQTDINNVAGYIEKQKNHFKEKLQVHVNPATIELQQSLCDYLNSDIQEPRELQCKLEVLKKQHIDHLAQNSDDILTEFNLAWMNFHFFEDFKAAKTYLTHVIDKTILEDSPLAQLALRYLALSDHFLGNNATATASLQRSASLDQTDNLYYLYEIAQQLIHTAKKDAAICHLKALIKSSPLYYIHIQSDPFFTDSPEVDCLLSRFHAARLEAIKETTYSQWKESEMMQQPLPQEFNQQALFNEVYEEHLTLLAHQPYPLLCRTKKISEKFLRNLQNKTQANLNTINQQLIQHIKIEQKKWKIINLIGVGMVYFAVLLTLASIFLFIGGDLLGLTSQKESIDWGSLVPKIFASVLGTGVLGIFLLQFNPPRLKQLAKKRSMLTQVID